MAFFIQKELNLSGYPVVWSPCKRYRYVLWRIFRMVPKTYIAWIGLNPSKATELKDDNTIRRCKSFSLNWGYEAMVMLNLFGYRSTDPKEMKNQTDPIGPDNDYWLKDVCKEADRVIMCWGTNGKLRSRDEEVYSLIRKYHKGRLYCLAENEDGTPLHPLFAKSNLIPVRY